jgi:recombinational DNA repair protein (RecF pathway)
LLEADRILPHTQRAHRECQGRKRLVGGSSTVTRELVLHHGRGELATVTGASLIRPHAAVRDDTYRLAVGLVGAETVLRLFPEQEQNERVFAALTRS